jgi:hypothetical protein
MPPPALFCASPPPSATLFETQNRAYKKVIDRADLFLQFFWHAKVCIFHSSSRVSFLIWPGVVLGEQPMRGDALA